MLSESDASTVLRELARRVTSAAAGLTALEAALLTGSAARGDADRYSDLDLILYVRELPDEALPARLCAAVGGANLVPIGERGEDEQACQFELAGVAVQVALSTVAHQDELLEQLLVRLENVYSPLQKVLSGLAEGMPLLGEELVERWKQRVAAYPEALRRATVEHYWRVFPLWWYRDALSGRDAELWRFELLLEAAQNLLGVLAGLNRVYYTPFELKRLRALCRRLGRAPEDLPERLESLFRLRADEAAAELGRLVVEVRSLVLAELPEAQLPLRRAPGERLRPW